MLNRIGIAATISIALAAALMGAVPNPIVTGPIPATVPPGDPSHDYPFFSTTLDLASFGYIEEEFLFEGTANRYGFPSPPLYEPTVSAGGYYKTRMVVRRPASPGKFNGIVLMEWQNVTAGYDLDALWATSSEHYLRRGYAWIGVSAQRAGIHTPGTGLKAWSPSRYGTLDVTRNGTIMDDALSFDIFSQAAQAVRSPVGVNPMGGLVVERVVAMGASQSTIRLVRYHNSIQPLAGVFDGFLLFSGGPTLRTDRDVKVFKILSETDVAGNQAALRQPDSDHFRRWEVAGSAHLDFYAAQAFEPLQARDLPPSTPAACYLPPLSRIPMRFVGSAAIDHMVAWVSHNIEPPTAPEIELLSITPTSAVVARDGFGNALGGIRLSQHAVPTATNTGLNSGPGYCSLYGSFLPFGENTLDALYGNHGKYVSQVVQWTHGTLKDGFIVPEDAVATIVEAAESEVGK